MLDACILLPGQVRLETSIFPSISGIFDYQEHFLKCENFTCFLWDYDLEKYKSNLNNRYNYVIGNEAETEIDNDLHELMIEGIIKSAQCSRTEAENAVNKSIKENYGWAKVFEKALQKNYKYFIKSRYDLVFKNKFDINKIKFLLDNPEPVIVMPFGDWGHRSNAQGCSTLFYVMNRPAAERMKDYNLQEIERAKNNEIFCTEAGFLYHLIKHKIHIVRFNFPITFNNWHKEDLWYSIDYNTDLLIYKNCPIKL